MSEKSKDAAPQGRFIRDPETGETRPATGEEAKVARGTVVTPTNKPARKKDS